MRPPGAADQRRERAANLMDGLGLKDVAALAAELERSRWKTRPSSGFTTTPAGTRCTCARCSARGRLRSTDQGAVLLCRWRWLIVMYLWCCHQVPGKPGSAGRRQPADALAELGQVRSFWLAQRRPSSLRWLWRWTRPADRRVRRDPSPAGRGRYRSGVTPTSAGAHARAALMVSESASWERVARGRPDEGGRRTRAPGEARGAGRSARPAATHLRWASDISPGEGDGDRRPLIAACT